MFAWISGFDNIHRIGTSQVVNMEKIISFSQKIKGIISIGLKSFTPINNLPPISVENSPLSIFFAEGLLEPFSNAVNVITVHLSSDLKIVVTEDYFLFISWKQNCLILFSNYSKIERIFSIFKGYSWGGNVKLPRGSDGKIPDWGISNLLLLRSVILKKKSLKARVRKVKRRLLEIGLDCLK